ncbi:transcription mediator subunit Med12 [Apiospora arundinis]
MADTPPGDHCVCHYPDNTSHTWLIHDDDFGGVAAAHDQAVEIHDTKTTGSSGSSSSSSSRATTAGAGKEEEEEKEEEGDAIAVPLRYTRQGDAIPALYCDCFVVVDEGSSSEAEPAAAVAKNHLFAGAVVLNHTSGDYDFVQLPTEDGNGFTKATAMFVSPPQHNEQASSSYLAPTTNNAKSGGGILGASFWHQTGLSRYVGVLACVLALVWVYGFLRVRGGTDTLGWRTGRRPVRSHYH